jgi:hypothetical protein
MAPQPPDQVPIIITIIDPYPNQFPDKSLRRNPVPNPKLSSTTPPLSTQSHTSPINPSSAASSTSQAGLSPRPLWKMPSVENLKCELRNDFSTGITKVSSGESYGVRESILMTAML